MNKEEYIARVYHDTRRKLKRKFGWKQTSILTDVEWDNMIASERILIAETFREMLKDGIICTVVDNPMSVSQEVVKYIDILWASGVRSPNDMSVYIHGRFPDIEEHDAVQAYEHWRQIQGV